MMFSKEAEHMSEAGRKDAGGMLHGHSFYYEREFNLNRR